MEYRILGPLEVHEGDRLLPVGTAKQQALLAVLVLHANEFVSRERLIDDLWGEAPPATAGKAVQVYVSGLRKLLGANGEGAIATRSGGYVLSLDREQLDLARFEDLVGEARRRAGRGEAEAAASLFREALGLWRGPTLAGLDFRSAARGEVERLEEERLVVLMDRVDCDLGLGRHERLVGELEDLVARYPLRERLRAQLMLALYRSDRQADALRVYREGRALLVEELGLEPSEALQRLERAILVHDPVLGVPAGIAQAEGGAAAAGSDSATDRAGAQSSVAPGEEGRRRARRAPWRALGAVGVVLVAVALGLALTLRGGGPASPLLEPNSVGFVEADTGRLSRVFPVGREPRALAVAFGSLWVAEYGDGIVSRLDRETGRSLRRFSVGGHPTAVTAYRGQVWVWTSETWLVAIDPDPDFGYVAERVHISVAAAATGQVRPSSADEAQRRRGGRIVGCGSFLWVTVPTTTVVRVNPEHPEHVLPISPDDGAQGPIACSGGEVWVGGFNDVFPVSATGIPGGGTRVGRVRDLAVGAGALWVASGSEVGQQELRSTLVRFDPVGRSVRATIDLPGEPVAVAAAGGSAWAALRDGTVTRVDPRRQDRVADPLRVGASPTDLLADGDGVWVAAG